MKRITNVLQDKRGSSVFIELAVFLLVCLMLLAVSVSFLQIYAKYNLINSMAHELSRYIQINGEVSSSTYGEFDRLKRTFGYSDANVNIDKTGRIPLEEPFTVVVTVQQNFGIGGFKVIPVTIKAVATGRSEKYWK